MSHAWKINFRLINRFIVAAKWSLVAQKISQLVAKSIVTIMKRLLLAALGRGPTTSIPQTLKESGLAKGSTILAGALVLVYFLQTVHLLMMSLISSLKEDHQKIPFMVF